MFTKDLQIPLAEMSMCLSSALDLVSAGVVDHHKRVAYIARSIAEECGLPDKECENLMIAGLLHDIGALSLRERLETLQFEIDNPLAHAELGYRIIKTFGAFDQVAPLVRYHHHPWDGGAGASCRNSPVPPSCHVLHLADRIAVLIDAEEEILGQKERITTTIRGMSGSKFVPAHVDAFMGLAEREYFWFDTVSPMIGEILKGITGLSSIPLNYEGLSGMTRLFSRIIDFRSRFTATHSSGVAASAAALAKAAGMTKSECDAMKIAGYLHDLGKLAVPAEILEKPAKLDSHELNIIKNHTYHTSRILGTVRSLDTINQWASLHHERMDGRGYPFHHRGEDLPLGSRIMAVADVFTALTEDRPYRAGMTRERALQTIKKMADDNALDADLVSMLFTRYDEINAVRMAAQAEESIEYHEFGSAFP